MRALASAAIVGVLLALAAGAVVPTLATVNYTAADETYYLHYARTLASQGPAVVPALFRGYVNDRQHWQFPNPLRLGFVAVSALWVKLFGASFGTLSYLSLGAHLAVVAVVALFLGRYMGAMRALLATALVAFSPLALGLARRALADGFVTLTSALAVGAFFVMLRPPDTRRKRAAFAVAWLLALVSKETAVLLLAPLAVFYAIERVRASTAVRVAAVTTALAVPLACWAALCVLAAGGVGTLARMVEIILASPSTNDYAIQFGSGPWYRYILDFLLLSPWPTLLALGQAGVTLRRLAEGRYEPLPVFAVVLCAGLLLEYSFFTKTVRYLALLDLPLRILAVTLLCDLTGADAARWRAGVAALLVTLICWMDYETFRLVFVSRQVSDPVSYWLLVVRRVLPVPGG